MNNQSSNLLQPDLFLTGNSHRNDDAQTDHGRDPEKEQGQASSGGSFRSQLITMSSLALMDFPASGPVAQIWSTRQPRFLSTAFLNR
jgi:hypothetical protein